MRMRQLVWFIGLILCGAAHAQQGKSLGNKLSDTLTRMQSTDLHTREAAFTDLMSEIASEAPNEAPSSSSSQMLDAFFRRHPDQAERVNVGLIQLLGKENETFRGKNVAPGTYTEEDMEHYAKAIDAVSSLNDGRAIPALIGAMTTGGMATRGLLKYGDNALSPVLDQLKNSDPLVRSTALSIAVTILERKNDPASHIRVRDLLQSSLGDSDSAVRTQAVMLVDCLDGRGDFIALLQQLAKGDPDRFPGTSDDGVDGQWYYPVRVQARRVLRDIQNNRVCKP